MEGQSLVSAYKFYSSWVRACIPQDITRAEVGFIATHASCCLSGCCGLTANGLYFSLCAQYRAHPDLQRGIELLKQAIKLGKGLTNPEELEVVRLHLLNCYLYIAGLHWAP